RWNPGAGATGPSVPRRSSGRQRSHVRLRDRNATENLHLHARPGLPPRRRGGSGRTHRAHHLRTARGRIRPRPDPGLWAGVAPAPSTRFHEPHRRARGRGLTRLRKFSEGLVGPRPTPPSACWPPVKILLSLFRQRDEGVPRGPGGPPHQLCPRTLTYLASSRSLDGGEYDVDVESILRAGGERRQNGGQGIVDGDRQEIAAEPVCDDTPNRASRIADRPDGSHLDSRGRRERLGQFSRIVQWLRYDYLTPGLHPG